MVKEKIELDEKTAAAFLKKGYYVTDKISEGAFGQVYKARKSQDGSMAAVKVMQMSKIPKAIAEKFIPREFEASTRIRHANVLEVYDIFKSNNCFYIFMEFAPNGSLMSLCKKSPIPENKSRGWLRQCARGLDCMHNKYKICHRDIKPDNVLLDARNICKLCDFGFARSMESEIDLAGTICGTVPFFAPELTACTGKYSPFASDCWAMGVTLYMMLNSGYPFPFPETAQDKVAMKAMNDLQVRRQWRHRDEVEQKLSAYVKDFIDKVLEPNVKKRFTTKQMLSHVWLA